MPDNGGILPPQNSSNVISSLLARPILGCPKIFLASRSDWATVFSRRTGRFATRAACSRSPGQV